MTYWRLEPTLRPPSYLYESIDMTELVSSKFSYRLFASEDHWAAWTEWATESSNSYSYDITVAFNARAFSSYVMQVECNLNSLEQQEGSGCCIKQKHYS